MAEHTWNISPLHCGISVSNLEACIEWFGRVLDFEVVSRDSIPAAGFDLAFLRNGDFEIELFQCYEYKEMSEERKVPNLDLKTLGTKHICFAVDNLDALVETFNENDVEIVQGPEHLIGNYYCFIHGPNDILIEFIEH